MKISKSQLLDLNGKELIAKAFAVEEYSERAASLVTDNSGMSGSAGIFQSHNGDMDSMWLTVKDPLKDNWIAFDLGEILQIGYMLVWNFNQMDATGAGIREAKILYSVDNKNWCELTDIGYPYIFAKADGVINQKATNLDDGKNSPINFNGLSARYIKIVPDERKNIGNWGDYIEGQQRYGLSQIRFYAYKPKATPNGFLASYCMSPDNEKNIKNVTSSYGLSTNNTKGAVHSNNSETMWLSKLMPEYGILQIDLDGTYPIGEMFLWNYNAPNQTGAGLKNVCIFHSIDGSNWQELKGIGYPYTFAQATGVNKISPTNLNDGLNSTVDFSGVRARYIKIQLDGGVGKGTWGNYNRSEYRYGVSKIRFFSTDGYCIEPARDFSGLLSNYNGWSGADGIFMVSVDGRDCKRTLEEADKTKSIIVFGDSILGRANPVTGSRKAFHMVNNTAAYMKGISPEKAELNFIHGKGDLMTCNSLIEPKNKDCIYWLQDCVVVGGKFYSFTDNIVEDLTKPEGFQFKLVGIDMIRLDIKNEQLDFNSLESFDTPLFKEGLSFGCGILPNTFEAEMPFADGYIYIYGLYDTKIGQRTLVAARVLPQDFENFSKYKFWDGKVFTSDITSAAPICDEGSSEMSITPIESGKYKGKYIYVYTPSSVGNMIACRIGETPYGPFGEKIFLYQITEQGELSKRAGCKIYTYNSKAHYHISAPDELLVTYNVNTTDFESHIKNSDIYRPRFIRIRLL